MFHLIYKDTNCILYTGTKKELAKILENTYNNCRSHYKVVSKQYIKELDWEF